MRFEFYTDVLDIFVGVWVLDMFIYFMDTHDLYVILIMFLIFLLLLSPILIRYSFIFSSTST